MAWVLRRPPGRPPSGRFDPVPGPRPSAAQLRPVVRSRLARRGRPAPADERLLAGPARARADRTAMIHHRQNVLFTLVLTVVISGIGTLTLAWPLFKLLLLAGLLLLAVTLAPVAIGGTSRCARVGRTRTPTPPQCPLRTASGFCRPRSCGLVVG